MTRIALGVLVTLAAFGCGGSLTAPTAIEQRTEPAADIATISGQIYSSVGPIYASIGSVEIDVNEADGSSRTVVTDSNGVYQISVRRGSVTITASKDGYEAKQWQFDLLNDVVLNFSLSPQ